MAKGYWIARVDVSNMDKCQSYIAANAAPFRQHGARFLVRSGQQEVPEGASRSRNVVIEFPSYQAALDCWNFAEYQAARQHRLDAGEIDLVIIEGYDGPQPD